MPGMPSSTPKLKQWMIQQVDSDKYPGLVWEDRKLGMFRIPWKHANHQDYRHDKDAAIFEAWAKFKGAHKGRHRLNPRTWKSRLRCALHKSSDFEEVPHFSKLNIFEPFKVYKIVDDNPEKKNLPSNIRLITVKTEPAPDDPRQAGGSDPGLGYKTSAREEDSGEIGPQQWNPPPSAEDRLPSAIPLCSVKVGGCQNAATANRQPSSPSRQLGMTEKQVKSETPSLDSQQMESDSGCDPGSGCETSAREEGSGDSTLSQCTLTPSTEEKLPSPVALSSVKVERSDSVGMETSQPSSPISRLGPTEEQAQGEVPVSISQQVQNAIPLHLYQQVRNDCPVLETQPMESDYSCDPSSGSETSTPEEGPGESTPLKWNLASSTEVAEKNYTINIGNVTPPNVPKESGPSLRFVNSYTFNISDPVPARLLEKVSNVYTININNPSSSNLPETVLNNYTINIGNPTPSSLPGKVLNNYTININSQTPPSLPEKVPNNYTININNPTPPSLAEKAVNNYTINVNNPMSPSLPEKAFGAVSRPLLPKAQSARGSWWSGDREDPRGHRLTSDTTPHLSNPPV
ncbi:uncharacterized protein [Scyliorhinus torazame]|uniref:uncharacterized protein isoform X2 n=1 Tax=Scyliorhinus torazame TaxID=75743 RepID=UPI003B5D0092